MRHGNNYVCNVWFDRRQYWFVSVVDVRVWTELGAGAVVIYAWFVGVYACVFNAVRDVVLFLRHRNAVLRGYGEHARVHFDVVANDCFCRTE